METTSAALFISISLVVFGISYYYFTTRHKERMEIIARGLAPDYFKGQTNVILLVLGMVSIGIALGLGAGIVISTLLQLEKLLTITFCVFLCLGLALISSYFLLKRIKQQG